MSNLTKLLIGVGVVAAAATVTYVVVKNSKKEESEETEINETSEPKEETLGEKIKSSFQKKAIKVVTWLILNRDKVAAVTTVIGLVSGIFSIINAVKEYKFGKTLRARLDYLVEREQDFNYAWNHTIDNYDRQWDKVLAYIDKQTV